MLKNILKDENGASVIEVAVIIVILVILAMVFQREIEDVLITIIEKIKSEIGGITSGGFIWLRML